MHMHKPALNYDWCFDTAVFNNDFSTVAVIQNVARSASKLQIRNDMKRNFHGQSEGIKISNN